MRISFILLIALFSFNCSFAQRFKIDLKNNGRYSCGNFRLNTPIDQLLAKKELVKALELNEQQSLDEFLVHAHLFKNLKHIEISGDVDLSQAGEGLSSITSLESLILSPLSGKLPQQLTGLKELKLLSLNASFQLFEFPNYVFVLPALEDLTLEGYFLTKLPENLGELKQLKALQLIGSFNNLPNSITELQQLESLKLETTSSFSSFPKSITQLPHLKVLKAPKSKGGLPRDILNLKNLEELDISWLGTKEFPEEVCRLTELRKLKLPNVTTPPPAEIINLIHLKVVNQLIFDESIYGLTSLEEATIKFLKSSKKVNGIAALSQLNQLVLNFEEGTRVSQLPDDLGDLKNLQTLVVNKGLRGTLESVDQLENLVELKYKSKIEGSFPKAFCSLTNLKVLRMEYCGFKGLIDDIGELTSLEVLALSGNDLNQLPPAMGKLINLKQFNAANCDITQISKEFFQCTELREIGLSRNPLTSIPSEIAQLTQLRRLVISQTQITEAPNIKELPYLYKLDLSRTPYSTNHPNDYALLKHSLSNKNILK